MKIIFNIFATTLLLLTFSDLTRAEVLKPLSIRDVKVAGEIGRRIDVTIDNNVLVLDADRDFLKPFKDRNRTGGYIGLGKFIDSLVRFAAYSNESDVITLKDHVVSETIRTQESGGYIGICKPDNRMWDLWDAHEMGYLVLGLTADYTYFRNEQSLQAAEKLAGYIIDRWSSEPERVTNGWVSVYVATTGLEEAMLALHKAGNNRKYLDFCIKHRKLPEWDVGIIEGRWGNLEGHAYHYVCRCLAQLQLYRIQPDERLLSKSLNVQDYLLARDGLLIPGLCSYQECWHSNQQGFFKLGETCSTAYLVRWLDTLLQLKGDSIYGDMMERIILNGLFAAQSPDGRKLRYYSPMEGERIYYNGDTYCCPCNYRRIIAELPGMIYYQSDNGVTVNLYTASSARFTLKGTEFEIHQKTDYPKSGKTTLQLDMDKPLAFPINLRIPRWCRNAEITVNGNTVNTEIKSGTNVTLNRTWQDKDTITLQMDMPFRLIKGRKSQAGRVAVMRGPVVFCLNPQRQTDFDTDIMRLMCLDPNSVKLSDKQSSIYPGDISCEAAFWNPNNYNAQAAPSLKLILTEYVDPGCQATYFLVPNPNSERLEDDELYLP